MYKRSLYALIVLFIIAGLSHFLWPEFFLAIMPAWVPWQKEIVLITGALEILFVLMLLFQKTRQSAAWLLIVLLIAIFPANIQMLINYLHQHSPNLWIAIIRLPFQPLLIWWAYSFIRPQKYYTEYKS